MSFFTKSKSSLRFREKHQKTYIIPTAYGVAFGFICFLLFSIAFASTNNAVYFLCFFLVSLGSQSLFVTNRNIESLQLRHLHGDDFFADEIGVVCVGLFNPGPQAVEEVVVELLAESQVQRVDLIKPGEQVELRLPLRLPVPGVHRLPALRLSSEFPYHFSRSWKKHYAQAQILVFPARVGSRSFSAAAYWHSRWEARGSDEFKGHRDYQRSDSPRSIDWKVSARAQKVVVREFDPQNSAKITLRWEDCPQESEAQKKSQLSLWIDLAEKNNFEYALELPQRRISFGKGPQHKSTCLRALL